MARRACLRRVASGVVVMRRVYAYWTYKSNECLSGCRTIAWIAFREVSRRLGPEGGDAVLSLLAVQLLGVRVGDPDRVLDRAIARVVD